MKSFIGELTWREMIHDITPDTDKILLEKSVSGYIGFDPTADSLHIGNLVQIIVLMHFQNYGNKPYILVGGATGMIGDPSGKSSERALLDKKSLDINLEKIKNQLSKFLKFNKKENSAVIVNNYEWMKKLSLIDFNRDIGKHITINYMMSKDSVKKRVSNESGEGMSFTEFSYQLIQGYDFLHLYKNYDCILQMGGSDQWGNITTGTELIRRKLGKKAFALTCKLLTKSDGSKFGKTASGNIWLDKEKTSPYKFYQYWLNLSDEDSEKFIKIFTFLPRAEIENLLVKHRNEKHKRILQKKLAYEITSLVHSKHDASQAIKASEVLFGKVTFDDICKLDENIVLEIFEGVQKTTVNKKIIFEKGIPIVDALSDVTNFLNSKSEARRALNENSISVNKKKVKMDKIIDKNDIFSNKFILLQRGKKNYFLIIIDDT